MSVVKDLSTKKVSRRVFLGTTGKLIGMGVLARFMLVGKAFGADVSGKKCTGLISRNYCNDGDKYNCTAASPHSCAKAGNFDCIGKYTCSGNGETGYRDPES